MDVSPSVFSFHFTKLEDNASCLLASIFFKKYYFKIIEYDLKLFLNGCQFLKGFNKTLLYKE